jgi:hypothetical protein
MGEGGWDIRALQGLWEVRGLGSVIMSYHVHTSRQGHT